MVWYLAHLWLNTFVLYAQCKLTYRLSNTSFQNKCCTLHSSLLNSFCEISSVQIRNLTLVHCAVTTRPLVDDKFDKKNKELSFIGHLKFLFHFKSAKSKNCIFFTLCLFFYYWVYFWQYLLILLIGVYSLLIKLALSFAKIFIYFLQFNITYV